MADVFGAEFFGGIKKLFRDMGDTSHAEVVALGAGTEAIGTVTTDQEVLRETLVVLKKLEYHLALASDTNLEDQDV